MSSQSHLNLVGRAAPLRRSLLPLTVATYLPRTFRLKASIKVDARYLPEETLVQAGAALRDAFSFARRDFGQHVSLDEVMAVLQAVTGVEGVDVDELAPRRRRPRAAARAAPARAAPQGIAGRHVAGRGAAHARPRPAERSR